MRPVRYVSQQPEIFAGSGDPRAAGAGVAHALACSAGFRAGVHPTAARMPLRHAKACATVFCLMAATAAAAGPTPGRHAACAGIVRPVLKTMVAAVTGNLVTVTPLT